MRVTLRYTNFLYQESNAKEMMAKIRNLNKQDRLVMCLRLAGYTYKEIGDVLGISKDKAWRTVTNFLR